MQKAIFPSTATSRLRHPIAGLAIAVVLGGCADLSGIHRSAEPVAPTAVGLAAPAAVAFEWPSERWWSAFGDARMDELVDRALAGNPSLKAAEARLARARSLVDFAEANADPRVDGSAQAMRQRFTENGLVPAGLAGRTRSTYSAMLDFRWELDFFGRNRAALQAALGAAQATEAELQASRLLLASEVVRSWVELARLMEQRRLAQETLAQHERMLELVSRRVDAGLDSRVELRRAQGMLPRTRAGIEAIEGEIALLRHALAVLSAQPVDALAGLEPRLPDARARALPAQIPAELLGRRADIAAARWRIEAAVGARDEAAARFYPNVNLAAFVGLSSLGLSRFLEAGSITAGVGPAVSLPVFDAGRLRAGLRGRTADLDEAVHTYNNAIAVAARDVADQLASLRSLERRDREQRDAQAAAEDAYALALQRYQAGLGTYLDVLSAQLAVIAERRVSADLSARAVELHAGLARALGGGYQAPDSRPNGSSR